MFLFLALLAASPVALKAARMFDARPCAILQPAHVVGAGKRISRDGGAPPAGAQVIDLGDVTLLPGLIDAHTHLTFEAGPSWYRDTMDNLLRWPAEQAQYAAEYARRTLDAGFTTVRDLGSAEFLDLGLRNAIDSGAVPGPRMIVALRGSARAAATPTWTRFRPAASLPQMSSTASATALRSVAPPCAGRSSTARAWSSSWPPGACCRSATPSTIRSSPRRRWTRSCRRRTPGAARRRRTATATLRPGGRSRPASIPSSTGHSSSPRRWRSCRGKACS